MNSPHAYCHLVEALGLGHFGVGLWGGMQKSGLAGTDIQLRRPWPGFYALLTTSNVVGHSEGSDTEPSWSRTSATQSSFCVFCFSAKSFKLLVG